MTGAWVERADRGLVVVHRCWRWEARSKPGPRRSDPGRAGDSWIGDRPARPTHIESGENGACWPEGGLGKCGAVFRIRGQAFRALRLAACCTSPGNKEGHRTVYIRSTRSKAAARRSSCGCWRRGPLGVCATPAPQDQAPFVGNIVAGRWEAYGEPARLGRSRDPPPKEAGPHHRDPASDRMMAGVAKGAAHERAQAGT